MWLLGSNIAIIIRSVRTGHVVSVVCSISTGGGILYSDRTIRTGQVVSVVCSIRWC